MGYYSELSIQLRDPGYGFDKSESNIQNLAAALNGEALEEHRILAPSPGKAATDRSLDVRVYSPTNFFVYSYEGSFQAARAHVSAALNLNPWEEDPVEAYRKSQAAEDLWSWTTPASGTPVEIYLRSRAITIPPPPSLRFCQEAKHGPTLSKWPTMIARVVDGESGSSMGIHRTFLAPGGKRKAPVKPEKMMLGPCAGGAVRLAEFNPDRPLLIGEGIETSLSAMVMAQHPCQAWAALSIAGLDALALPDSVRSVVVLADNDGQGQRAAHRNASRWEKGGREVKVTSPPPEFNDFNDMLVAVSHD
jgi:hypothetical protein